MSTEIAEQLTTTELAIVEEFEITKQQISEAVELANKATVDGPADKEGMKLCRDYRIGLKTMRTTIDKRGKSLRAKAVERQKLVLKVTKDLIAPIPAAESRLQELEDTAKREQQKLDEIALQKRADEIKRRCELATAIGWIIPPVSLQSLSQEDFDLAYADKQADHEAAEKAKAAEVEALRLEQERLEQEAAKQREREAAIARKEAEQREIQKKLDDALREAKLKLVAQRSAELAAVGATMDADGLADLSNDYFAAMLLQKETEFNQRKAEEAKAAKLRQEQAVKDAAEKAKREAEEEAERTERERLAAIEAEAEKKRKVEAAAKRKAARAPDREKILVFRSSVDAIVQPKLSKDSKHQQNRIEEVVNTLLERLQLIADELA